MVPRTDEEALRVATREILTDVQDTTMQMLHSRTPTALAQLRAMYRDIVKLYLKHGDFERLQAEVASLDARHTHHELVRKAIQLTIGGDEFSREVASDLIFRLVSTGTLTTYTVQEGFLRVLRGAAELLVDFPDAPTTVAKFIARALADGVLPPGFFASLPKFLVGDTMASPTFAFTDVSAASSPEPHLPPPMNTLARREAERSTDGSWLSVEGSSGSAAHSFTSTTSTKPSQASVSAAAGKVLDTAKAIVAEVPLSEAQAARLKSVWGFRRPMAELRGAIAGLISQFGALGEAPSDEALESYIAAVTQFECNELIPDLITGLILHADTPAVAANVSLVLSTLTQRRIVRPRRLQRGLLQVLEHIARLRRGEGEAVRAAFLHILVHLARTGCVADTFFVDVAPELDEDTVDDESETSSGGPSRSSVAELRFQFAAALSASAV